VFYLGEDVFGAVEPEPEPAAAPFAEGIAATPPAEPLFEEPAPPPAGAQYVGPPPAAEPAVEEAGPTPRVPLEAAPLAVMSLQPPGSAEGPLIEPEEFPEEPEPEGASGLPAPSLTLARLALAQGDRELAERTLEEVLEQDPDAVEAAELLNVLRGERAGAPGDGLRAAHRVAALQGWLERFRLAAERLQA
jgi:hypothetical protein